jgi:hypothetical protein
MLDLAHRKFKKKSQKSIKDKDKQKNQSQVGLNTI